MSGLGEQEFMYVDWANAAANSTEWLLFQQESVVSSG